MDLGTFSRGEKRNNLRAIIGFMKVLVGNWKMAPDTLKGAVDLAKKTSTIAKTHKKNLQVIIAVPFPHISLVTKNVKNLGIAAQNISSTINIASTGSVNAAMLKSYGVSYSIVGHSESRALGDTNEMTNEQIKRLLEKKITPILCIGEKSRDAQGWYLSAIKEQIEIALEGVLKASVKKMIIAYEPVWAIGKNASREATPHECFEMIIFIRKIISDIYDEKIAAHIPVLYGGSVDEDNANTFTTDGGADGLLVGRVSLDAKRFSKLAANISK